MSGENPMGIRTTSAGTSSDVIVPRAQWNTQQKELKRLRGIEARLNAKRAEIQSDVDKWWREPHDYEYTRVNVWSAMVRLLDKILGEDGSDGDE